MSSPQTTAPTHDYAFCFKPPGRAIEADTLAEALGMAPDLAAADLTEVWCLHTCNCVWGFVGDPTPWRDPEPAA
jgi:hypothetical protein